MKLVAKSRDQGFIDDPLAGNWTWFEIAILKTKYSEEPRVKDGIHLVWVSHRNRFLSKDYGWEEGVEFGKDHDIFRLLEEGNVIAVRLCARFQAWQIKARTGYLVLDIGAPAGEKPLLVLSLDGGGVRGVAALMHLDAIMKKVAPGKKPCEVFDMIGGTSTGGFIAIMLGRLLVKSGSKWDASELDKCIKQLVQEQLGQDPDQVLLLDEESAKTCKVFVMATRQEGANNQAPVLFRSYENPLEKSELPGIKLWEAARATSAAPMYFAPLEVGGYKFLNGGLQANNPMGWLWNEVLSVFSPARSTNCFLSIGTGIAATKAVGDVRNLKGFTEPVAMLATNSKITKLVFRSLINAFAPKPMAKKYCRFNVCDGLPE
ncbi:Calcium-independent phospholipase A2-gamma [Fusarium oxysporum f. sp. rapae]|uniref:Calcium-independent phospholipase A2-gamma n=1 Tax=Fusarium oxysporum f. sp. rapae TaxID=485398 RepID=A0A8J5NZS5_FUSOX|nr:Calcium-independent phospholipase A2-gamma [Fusarium oxysporum f. sp. rapae]